MTGTQLKQRREQLGLTQLQLALIWKMNRVSITRLEDREHELQASGVYDCALLYLESLSPKTLKSLIEG